MAQLAVNIPHSIDEKDSFDDSGDLDTAPTDPRGYTVPSLDIDLTMEPDRSRKRRFSVSAESNANDDSDFDDDLDDDSKSQSHHSRNNSYGSNHSGNSANNNNNNNTANHNHSNHSSGSASVSNGSRSSHQTHATNNENNNTNNISNNSKYNGFGRKKKHFIRKIYPKTQSAKSRIYASVSDLFLWNGLDSEQQNLLVDAMFEKKVKKNENIITQGDRGDYFYVIESGVYEVWKTESNNNNNNNGISGLSGVGRNRNDILSELSEPQKVYEYDNRGSFGELALMYNSPRAATVKAKTDGILWAVDRKTFRHIIVGSTARKRHRYDKFLKTIEAFDKLPGTITSQMADILEGFEFRQNEKIIEQGSNNCEKFYLIQRGTANVVIRTNDGKLHIVSKLRDGDFFGERALLQNDLRSATVIVTSKTMICCAMDKASFMRLLNSLYDYFKIRMDSYTNKSDLGDDDVDSDLGSDQE